jgi:uncharacterized membrane protein
MTDLVPNPNASGLPADAIGTRPASAEPGEPRTASAGSGGAWWKEGWHLFARSPFVWIAVTLLYVLIMIALSAIPLVNMIAPSILGPVFAGGVLSGFREVDRGAEAKISYLFASFNERLVPLAVLGLLYLVATFVIVLIAGAVLLFGIGVEGLKALLSGDPVQSASAMLGAIGYTMLLAILVGLLLGIPVAMAFWFAPALVALEGSDPIAAIKRSFEGCLRNILSMLVYGLYGIVLAILATIPFGLGWIVLAPVFAGSVYASYKEIFN